MAQSKAHVAASNKYNKENYDKLQANVPKDFNAGFCQYCFDTRTSKTKAIINACSAAMKHRTSVRWSPAAYELFISEGCLISAEISILNMRIRNVPVSVIAKRMGLPKGVVRKMISRIQIAYDGLQIQHPDVLPVRIVSPAEVWMNEN